MDIYHIISSRKENFLRLFVSSHRYSAVRKISLLIHLIISNLDKLFFTLMFLIIHFHILFLSTYFHFSINTSNLLISVIYSHFIISSNFYSTYQNYFPNIQIFEFDYSIDQQQTCFQNDRNSD